MKHNAVKPSDWKKPEMHRLGTISEVAGAQTPVSQGSGNVKS